MKSSPLPNYLLANRKRLALSQHEVAFLLGQHGGDNVSRYENYTREPNLQTILAMEAIFQKPANQLFAGLYERIEREVAARAKVLTYKTDLGRSKSKVGRKRDTLNRLAKPIQN